MPITLFIHSFFTTVKNPIAFAKTTAVFVTENTVWLSQDYVKLLTTQQIVWVEFKEQEKTMPVSVLA